MEHKDTAKLFDLAIHTLLSNETAAIRALEEIPPGLFVPLFSAAFRGGHKNVLMEMVKIWPFPCLHIGALNVQEPQRVFWKAMIENLQVVPTQNSAPRSSKLRILDLRQNVGYKIICPGISSKSPVCLHSCVYSEHSALDMEAECSNVNAESEVQSSKQSMQLIVDISLDGTFEGREFFSLLMSKVEQSLGSLHLCCRDLKIDNFSDCKSSLSFLNLNCVNYLEVDQVSLIEVTHILSQVVQLYRLSLSKVTFRSLIGKAFKSFITQLGRMDSLKELSLTYFYLSDHLETLLRAVPPALHLLSLPFCALSNNDFRFLSQCPQANHLKWLKVSNNRIYWEDCEAFQDLLEKVSGTLQHLEIDHCLLTDSTISVLIPSLSQCSHLRVLSFASNPITMFMLTRVVEHLTPLLELKSVIYPVPVHCYGRWHFRGSLDRERLANVHAELMMMLEMAQRADMNWVTYSE